MFFFRNTVSAKLGKGQVFRGLCTSYRTKSMTQTLKASSLYTERDIQGYSDLHRNYRKMSHYIKRLVQSQLAYRAACLCEIWLWEMCV